MCNLLFSSLFAELSAAKNKKTDKAGKMLFFVKTWCRNLKRNEFFDCNSFNKTYFFTLKFVFYSFYGNMQEPCDISNVWSKYLHLVMIYTTFIITLIITLFRTFESGFEVDILQLEY